MIFKYFGRHLGEPRRPPDAGLRHREGSLQPGPQGHQSIAPERITLELDDDCYEHFGKLSWTESAEMFSEEDNLSSELVLTKKNVLMKNKKCSDEKEK